MAGWQDGETASGLKRINPVHAATGSRAGNV
jgi:hypothetical protein